MGTRPRCWKAKKATASPGPPPSPHQRHQLANAPKPPDRLVPVGQLLTSPVKARNLPDYPTVSLSDLSQLRLDEASGRRFERRFLPGTLGGIVVASGGFFVGWAMHRFGELSSGISGLFILVSLTVGASLSYWTRHRMMRARPLSLQTGQEMSPFVVGGLPDPDYYEIAYIDAASGTYFRRRYIE